MRNNPVARALADARNRRRILPDKRHEKCEAMQCREAETSLDEGTPGGQIAQCVDDMLYGMIGVAIGSEEHREDRRSTYVAAKEKLTGLLDEALPRRLKEAHGTMQTDQPSTERLR